MKGGAGAKPPPPAPGGAPGEAPAPSTCASRMARLPVDWARLPADWTRLPVDWARAAHLVPARETCARGG
jgi:hypothetical protein